LGGGSLLLSTATTSEKITLFNFDHLATRLADIDNISYSTYRLAGVENQLAAIVLTIDYNGLLCPGGFATLVFEPAYNLDQQPVQNNVWQQWNATGSAIWWSTAPINGQCASASATCRKSWDYIVANNPNAIILGGVGINQGTGNPGLTTAVDAFTFDETTYDFDPFATSQNTIVGIGSNQPAATAAVSRKTATTNDILLANHPNPFTSTTRIQYQLSMDSRVSIIVYDATGKELETLVNAHQKAGNYFVNFNASGLGNGVYYYKLIATGKGKTLTQSRSMIIAQ
jgi:hypothetical protein